MSRPMLMALPRALGFRLLVVSGEFVGRVTTKAAAELPLHTIHNSIR